MQGQKKLKAPEDKAITTLYIRDLTPDMTEKDLIDVLEQYGTITNTRIIADKKIAFATFTTREMAEEAIKNLYGKFIVKNQRLVLAWGKHSNRPNTNQMPEEEVKVDEEQLVPQPFQFPVSTIKPTNPNIKPPSGPPPGAILNNNITNKFIMNLTQPGNAVSYPSMNPHSLGGVKKDTRVSKAASE